MRFPSMYRLICLFAFCLTAGSAHAVYEKKDGFPWNLPLFGYHDKPIFDALPEGSFMMNVGPTGIRAKITHENPSFFTVKFVFPNSPAAGKIKAGDIIVGANNHVMDVPHQFGRRTVSGWAGPMEEMAKLIEDSQGKQGNLELMVWQGGDRNKAKKVMIKIRPVGRFSKTFPFNCERSDKLMIELCDFLVKEYEREHKFGRPHANGAAILALMASGQNKYSNLIRQIMSRYPDKRYSSENGGGFPTWGWGYDGIVMGEYYRLTKDKSLIPAMESLAVAYRDGQDWSTGGYMHKPYPFITQRIASGGPKGYGSMSQPGGLAMIAQSIFEHNGLNYDEACYQRIHQAFLRSVGANGEIGYGFKAWDHAVIKLKGDSIEHAKQQDARGIGYYVQTGMEGLKNFDVIWPTPNDPRYKPLDWIVKESNNVRSYVTNKNELVLVRDMSLSEPKVPFKHNGRRTGHYGRSGQGAIAHAIGSAQHPAWRLLATHMAQSCANSPDSIFDGHASTLMHTLWGSLGASFGGEKAFQHYMNGIKWWFIMGQTHDGGFVPMPGRDYASTDHVYATRVMPSATAALILSVKEHKLLITGASTNMAKRPKKDDDPKEAKNPRRTASREVDLSMLGSDFTVQHCESEARLLAGKTPYARILESLDKKAEQDNEQGQEAAEFARRLRAWLNEQTIAIIREADEKPAQVLAHASAQVRRMAGVPNANVILAHAKLEYAGNDADTRTLARYVEQFDKVSEQVAERGPNSASTTSKKQLRVLLERYVQKPGLSSRLRDEAMGMLSRL